MRLIIGSIERETRRGSYWAATIIATSEPGAAEWYSEVVATAQGETRGLAFRRAQFIRNKLLEVYAAPRLQLGLPL